MGARKGVQNVFGGGEMEDKRFWPGGSGLAHEIGDSGLAYRDDSIGDSWGYAHTLACLSFCFAPTKFFRNKISGRTIEQLSRVQRFRFVYGLVYLFFQLICSDALQDSVEFAIHQF